MKTPETNDEIREHILAYLYSTNQKARSPTSAEINIRSIQSDLKEKYGYKQQQVASNLNYLIDKGWITQTTQTKNVSTKGGMTVPSTSIKYRITAQGTDHMEGPSKFGNQNVISGINIKNVSGTVIVGDSNIVIHEKYTDLYNALEHLHRNILSSDNIDDAEKLEIISDINSLKNQLSKSKPDPKLINKLWETIKCSVTIHGFTKILTDTSSAISDLFS